MPRGSEPGEKPLLWWVWHHPGKEAMGMQLPKVILKVKAPVRGSQGLPSAVQPSLNPFVSPQIGVLLDWGM